MPGDDMITVQVPGLYAGSEQNIYNSEKGSITFIRGNYDIDYDDNVNDKGNTEEQDTVPANTEANSKESRIAAIYCRVVHH